MRARREIVALGKQSSQLRLQPERVEHPTGDVLPVRFLHLVVRTVSEVRAVRVRYRDQLGLILHHCAQLAEQRIFEALAYSEVAGRVHSLTSENVQPFGLRHWQRTQQQCVDEPECRCARSDRQSQRQDRRGGSYFILSKLPPAEDSVCAVRIEPRDQPDVAAFLAPPQGGAERSPGFRWVAALADRLRDVRFEFFIDFAAQPTPEKYICDARP